MKGEIEALKGIFGIQRNALHKYAFLHRWHKG